MLIVSSDTLAVCIKCYFILVPNGGSGGSGIQFVGCPVVPLPLLAMFSEDMSVREELHLDLDITMLSLLSGGGVTFTISENLPTLDLIENIGDFFLVVNGDPLYEGQEVQVNVIVWANDTFGNVITCEFILDVTFVRDTFCTNLHPPLLSVIRNIESVDVTVNIETSQVKRSMH